VKRKCKVQIADFPHVIEVDLESPPASVAEAPVAEEPVALIVNEGTPTSRTEGTLDDDDAPACVGEGAQHKEKQIEQEADETTKIKVMKSQYETHPKLEEK